MAMLAATLLTVGSALASSPPPESAFMPLRIQQGQCFDMLDFSPTPVVHDSCALDGAFYMAVDEPLSACLAACEMSAECGGFSYKLSAGTGEKSPAGEGNCTGAVGSLCCYMQHPSDISGSEPRTGFSCWEKPAKPGKASFALGSTTTPFGHFW